ncbi:MAG: cytochrome C oxidase subunit IV family protein [Panacagrimonas sp.]
MSLRALVFNGSSLVWLALSLATGLSWWLGTGHLADESATGLRQTALVVIGIAFFKVRLVIQHFMEVRHAPLALRLITDGWVVGVCCAVMAFYLWA